MWWRRSALSPSTPQLLPVLLLLGSTRSDLWILNLSRVLLLHVLVCVSRVLQCSWQNRSPSYLLLHYILTSSEERCISLVCDSPREKPYRSMLHCFSSNQRCDPIVFILENKSNSQTSGMLFTLTFGLPSTTTQKLSAKNF